MDHVLSMMILKWNMGLYMTEFETLYMKHLCIL